MLNKNDSVVNFEVTCPDAGPTLRIEDSETGHYAMVLHPTWESLVGSIAVIVFDVTRYESYLDGIIDSIIREYPDQNQHYASND